MKKYLPYVQVHCKDGELDVYEQSHQEYDTLDQAFAVGNAIREDMLQVDVNCDPTVFVKERTE